MWWIVPRIFPPPETVRRRSLAIASAHGYHSREEHCSPHFCHCKCSGRRVRPWMCRRSWCRCCRSAPGWDEDRPLRPPHSTGTKEMERCRVDDSRSTDGEKRDGVRLARCVSRCEVLYWQSGLASSSVPALPSRQQFSVCSCPYHSRLEETET